jgi:hypothetical protein
MVDNIIATTEELVRRGITFTQNPEPISEGATMYVATFLTPHGICVDLWGEAAHDNKESFENKQNEEDESPIEEEAITPVLPSPIRIPQSEFDVDDLFEEIHDEPKRETRPGSRTRLKPKPHEPEETEEDFPDEIEYVDEAEANYPAYQPIPLRK